MIRFDSGTTTANQRSRIGPSRRWSLRLAATALAAVAAAFVVFATPEPIAVQSATSVEGPCVITTTHIVDPETPRLGAEVTVTTGMLARCPEAEQRLHVILLVDASEHMRNRSRDWLGELLADLETAVRGLSRTQFAQARIGVVSFSEGIAQSEARLTDEVDELVIGLHNIAIRPGDTPLGGLGEGMRKSRRMFQSGRESAGDLPVREVIVLASRGFESAECEAVRASANDVKSSGILLVTACGGGACERRCLAEAASTPQLAFASSGWGYLGLTLSQILDSTGPFHPLAEVSVVDVLSDRLMYSGGGDPNAGLGNRLEWTFRPWPVEGITRSYHARVLGTGRFQLSERVWATLRFNPTLRPIVVSSTVVLDSPWLDVVPPSATPAPTATPDGATVPTPFAGPTPTPSPVRSPSATAAAGPSETAEARRPRSLFLPVTLAGGCSGGPWPVDVVLAIDVSGSMQAQDVEPMLSRWHAAREVALDLVQFQLLADDRVAVVPFAETAEVRAGLADGRDRALDALDRLPRWNGSRMDLAMDVARQELAAARAAGGSAHQAIVLLTDGELNQTEVDALVRSSAAARSSGIAVYVVVLGRGADMRTLVEVTGGPGRILSSFDTRLPAIAYALAAHLHCPH